MKLPQWIFDGQTVQHTFAFICIAIGVAFISIPFLLALLLEKGQWYSR